MNKKYLLAGIATVFIIVGAGCSKTVNNIPTQQPTQPNDKETATIENCAKEGEKSTGLDMTTGKLKPGGKFCCKGLKPIGPKTDDETLKQGICTIVSGGSLTCTSCGDNVCDTKYEDKCNCPEDCK